MSMRTEIFKGAEVKELLENAVGGVYVGQCFTNTVTNFYPKRSLAVTDEGLRISKRQCDPAMMTIDLSIDPHEEYINYAVAGEDEDRVWSGSIYFDYKFSIGSCMIAFHVSEKDTALTFEQVEELVSDKACVFCADSIDSGSLNMSLNECIIAVDYEGVDLALANEISIISGTTRITMDGDIIDAIYNDSAESGDIYYRIEFNNGMPDITLQVEDAYKVFR